MANMIILVDGYYVYFMPTFVLLAAVASKTTHVPTIQVANTPKLSCVFHPVCTIATLRLY